jgi:hypothetical protein
MTCTNIRAQTLLSKFGHENSEKNWCLQDEVLELHEKEETAAAEAAAAVERAKHAALMLEANMDGIETLADDMVVADTEWAKLSAVPGLLEPWHDVRDKWLVATDEFKVRTRARGRGWSRGIWGQLPGSAEREAESGLGVSVW